MIIKITVPELPESVTDATVASWLVKLGDTVSAEDTMLELETDKVILDVPAPEKGIITEIIIKQGATVVAGDVLALLDTKHLSSKKMRVASTQKREDKIASPSVRKVLQANDLRMHDIPVTGKKGRVLHDDIKSYIQQANKNTSIEPLVLDNESTSKRAQKRVPMTRFRKRIAERLLDAQQQAAILTTFNDVDLTEVIRIRKQYQEQFIKKHGIKLGFMSFFIKAVTEALKRYPDVNARITGDDIIYQGFYDIGVAISTDRGLVVPVIHNVDSMDLATIEKQIADYAIKGREGRLELSDLTGGTFSVTNGGVFGSMLSTPILNPPQSAILGMHRIEKRAVVVDDAIVIRSMMYLALSYDHRIIDGKTSVLFLNTIKHLLEDPASILLEI